MLVVHTFTNTEFKDKLQLGSFLAISLRLCKAFKNKVGVLYAPICHGLNLLYYNASIHFSLARTPVMNILVRHQRQLGICLGSGGGFSS